MNDLMKGKKGLIMGVANDHSIAWGMAKALHEQGAELAFTYQGDAFGKRVKPLAESVGSNLVMDCDASSEEDLDRVCETLEKEWGSLDFIIHAIAYSNKDELQGRYVDTTPDNFVKTMHISCYSFTKIACLASSLMVNGGSLITLTFDGSNKVMPCYNVMGVAKAALESSVKYLSVDLGDKNIRVNAISAGPMRTLSGAVIGKSREVYKYAQENSPLKRNVHLEEIGNTATYLISEMSRSITGEIHYVDCGFNIIGMPKP